MRGTVTSVFERILSTCVAATDDVLQIPVTLSLKELLSISPALSDCFIHSFQDDESHGSVVGGPPTPSTSLPVGSQPPYTSVPSLSVPSHGSIPYVPCLTVIGHPEDNRSGKISRYTCATCSRAFVTARRLKRHTRVHRVVRQARPFSEREEHVTSVPAVSDAHTAGCTHIHNLHRHTFSRSQDPRRCFCQSHVTLTHYASSNPSHSCVAPHADTTSATAGFGAADSDTVGTCHPTQPPSPPSCMSPPLARSRDPYASTNDSVKNTHRSVGCHSSHVSDLHKPARLDIGDKNSAHAVERTTQVKGPATCEKEMQAKDAAHEPCDTPTQVQTALGSPATHGDRASPITEATLQRNNPHLHTWQLFPLSPIHPTPAFTSSRSQYAPTCSHPHRRQVPLSPLLSSSSTPCVQTPPTRTPLATTTPTRDVTQRARRTEAQTVTRSHEAATLTDVHAGMHATHATTREDDHATHTKDAARQTHETPTQAQAASHDASTCETAAQTPAATTTYHQHRPLHPHPSPAARLPQAPWTYSAAIQTAGTPHGTNKAHCRGFGCSMSHSADAHVPDVGDTRTHPQRSDAGSEGPPTGTNRPHATKCATQQSIAVLTTSSVPCIPSLPAPPSSYRPVSPVPRLYSPVLSHPPVRRPCPLIVPIKSMDGSDSFPVSSLLPSCYITSIIQLRTDDRS
jgi:hypothetical protein